MAKAETLGRGDGTGSTYKDYTGLLGVVAAGLLGISLLCITSAIALSAPNAPTAMALEPASIVDLAVNNINTVAALTVQALSVDNESTPFLLPSKTPTASASPTATLMVIPTFTQRAPTKTRAPRIPSTATPKPPPTKTAIPPSQTNVPPTNTPLPTSTPIPPTATVPPTATNAPPTATVAAPTDTALVPTVTVVVPTNTVVVPTNTSAPLPATNTPMPNPISDNTATLGP